MFSTKLRNTGWSMSPAEKEFLRLSIEIILAAKMKLTPEQVSHVLVNHLDGQFHVTHKTPLEMENELK